MIGRKPSDTGMSDVGGPKGFDDFDLKLGDIMRGERATMGKSLLDVQRELRIKASYIAAIENCDPSAFDTPGFIAGYVRSYARYLNMDPDETFRSFCEESGFQTAHGMSEAASVIKKNRSSEIGTDTAGRDVFAEPALPFSPEQDSILSRIEPGAIGSTLVLLAVIAGIGYGGWSVLQEVQRVQVTPVDQTPVVLSDLDPLDTAVTAPIDADQDDTLAAADLPATDGMGVFSPPSAEALDRLYRPQALDVPVLVARDAPISTLDPGSVGSFAESVRAELPRTVASIEPEIPAFNDPSAPSLLPQVVEQARPGVTVVAVRPAWVRVRASDGTTIHEAIMNAGDTYEVPQSEEPPTIRVGESGAVYFAVNGTTYGPAGARGSVTSNLALSVDNLTERYTVANIEQDRDLARVVAELNTVPENGGTPEN